MTNRKSCDEQGVFREVSGSKLTVALFSSSLDPPEPYGKINIQVRGKFSYAYTWGRLHLFSWL